MDLSIDRRQPPALAAFVREGIQHLWATPFLNLKLLLQQPTIQQGWYQGLAPCSNSFVYEPTATTSTMSIGVMH